MMTANLNSSTDIATVAGALAYCHHALQALPLFFGHGTDNAWDEAVQLVLCAADLPVDAGEEVLNNRLDAQQQDKIRYWLERRTVGRVPLPYLTGRAWFAGLEFACDERAIVPRSPIAELLLAGLSPWYQGPPPARMLDLCCGGGCIGLAAAHYLPGSQVDLLDIDAQALELAAWNRRLHGLQDRVSVLVSDLCSAVAGCRYDVIFCNPPYVDAKEIAAMPDEYQAEPALALGSGDDGLDLTRKILAQVGELMEPHGLLVLEVGASWPALEAAYPTVPFTWVELAHGGEGVCVLSAAQWQDYSESFCA